MLDIECRLRLGVENRGYTWLVICLGPKDSKVFKLVRNSVIETRDSLRMRLGEQLDWTLAKVSHLSI